MDSIELSTGKRGWFVNNSKLSINQKEVLDLIHHNKFSVIYKNRGDGVSTVLHLYIMWRIVESPGISIALMSHPNSRDLCRQNMCRNLKTLKINSVVDNVNKTIFDNDSRVSYFSGQSPDSLWGHSVNIIIFDDLPTDYQERFLEDSILVRAAAAVRNSKIIISTSEPSFKNTIDNSVFKFQEIYGSFFNGKRQVLVEKISVNKQS